MPFDSRSAMVRGGLTDGFGDLAAALMMAPQLRRKNDNEEREHQDAKSTRAAERAADEQYRRDQLAQSLGIHQDQLALDRERLKATTDANAAETTRRSFADLGSGIDHAWGRANDSLRLALAGRTAPRQAAPFVPRLYKEVPTFDPETGRTTTQQVLKSSDELAQERELYNQATGRPSQIAPQQPPKAQKPADPIEAIAARRAENQRQQEMQRAQGLMTRPGDAPPIPSTAGMPPVQDPRNFAPAVPPSFQQPPQGEGQQMTAPPAPAQRPQPRRFTPEESTVVRKMPVHWQQALQQVLETGDPAKVEEAYRRIRIMVQKEVVFGSVARADR